LCFLGEILALTVEPSLGCRPAEHTQLGCATATNRKCDSNRNRQELPRRASPISCGSSS